MNTGFDLDVLNEELENLSIDMTEYGFDSISEEDVELKEDGFDFDDDGEPKKEAKSKRGQIYKLGNCILMCGDSTNADDVGKLMNGNVADMVVTDPPYNVAIQNSDGNTIQSTSTQSLRDTRNTRGRKQN